MTTRFPFVLRCVCLLCTVIDSSLSSSADLFSTCVGLCLLCTGEVVLCAVAPGNGIGPSSHEAGPGNGIVPSTCIYVGVAVQKLS